MKKFISLLLVIVLALSLVGCSGDKQELTQEQQEAIIKGALTGEGLDELEEKMEVGEKENNTSVDEVVDMMEISEDMQRDIELSLAQVVATSLKSDCYIDYAGEYGLASEWSEISDTSSVWEFGMTSDLDGDGVFEVIGKFTPDYTPGIGFNSESEYMDSYRKNADFDVYFVISPQYDTVFIATKQNGAGAYYFAYQEELGKTFLVERSSGVGKYVTIYEWKDGTFVEYLNYEKENPDSETQEIKDFESYLFPLNVLPKGNGSVAHTLSNHSDADYVTTKAQYSKYFEDKGILLYELEGTLKTGEKATALFLKEPISLISNREYVGFVNDEKYGEVAGLFAHNPFIYKTEDLFMSNTFIGGILLIVENPNFGYTPVYAVTGQTSSVSTEFIDIAYLDDGVLTFNMKYNNGNTQTFEYEFVTAISNYYIYSKGNVPSVFDKYTNVNNSVVENID